MEETSIYSEKHNRLYWSSKNLGKILFHLKRDKILNPSLWHVQENINFSKPVPYGHEFLTDSCHVSQKGSISQICWI